MQAILCKALLLALVWSTVSVVASAADTAALCHETSCASAATCTTSPCEVMLSVDGNSVKISVNGQPTSQFCVGNGNKVKWMTSDADSLFGVGFSSERSPFSRAILVGDSNHPATFTAAANGATTCYIYSATVCNFQGVCGTNDPKVVVTH